MPRKSTDNKSAAKNTNTKTKAKTFRNKPCDQSIVNVVKSECCPTKAENPIKAGNSISAYTKLAKDGDRFM